MNIVYGKERKKGKAMGVLSGFSSKTKNIRLNKFFTILNPTSYGSVSIRFLVISVSVSLLSPLSLAMASMKIVFGLLTFVTVGMIIGMC